MRIRCARVKFPQSERLQPARSRTLLEASSSMAKTRAQGRDEKNCANETKPQNQEYARVIAAGEFRHHLDGDRNDHQIAEEANHPGRDFAVLALAFRPAVGPIRAPQPG